MGGVVRFTKEDRSTFPYWFAHWCSYQMVALNWGVWKWKYILHDIEKPWLLSLFKLIGLNNPYKRVQKFHREHNNHHLAYKGRKSIDLTAMLIDWESSMYTKKASPRNAVEEIEYEFNNKKFDENMYHQLRIRAKELNLYDK